MRFYFFKLLLLKKVNEQLIGKNADMSLVSKLVKEKIMTKQSNMKMLFF